MYRYKALKVQGKKIDEHRLVMQNEVGRKLGYNEIVHHEDNDPRNNNPDNLKIKTRSQHAKDHWANGDYNITKENTPGRKAARHALALKIGKRVMICDENWNELMIVRSIKLASVLTGTSRSTLWNIIACGKNHQTSPYKFKK